ncbi:MAG: sodium:proton antiporter NhaD [Chthonomonadaceae bacterium]|nr:sodium:proton antiporter NhaD [Chthonomonadaceae bacterium]
MPILPAAVSIASMVHSPVAMACVAIFVIAYLFVMFEERLNLRKSIPVILAAGAIWVLVIVVASGISPEASQGAVEALRHNILEFAELFLFLVPAITYVNTMEERQVFDSLRFWLVERGFSLRALFWITGGLAFLISPVADNLTTTLVMGAVAISVGGNNPRFVAAACVNIVVAANAGGAFSPFGDITTLMVWQKGIIQFWEFFALALPSLVTWLVPATIMSFFIASRRPRTGPTTVALRPGARTVIALFLCTIAGTVLLHTQFDLPPALGMMTGLGVLNLYAHVISRAVQRNQNDDVSGGVLAGFAYRYEPNDTFDVFKQLMRFEWDTLMFFYGVILCVGGLGALGFLELLSNSFYRDLGPMWANIFVGGLSAIVDNIPIMFAVLQMRPDMSHEQWLLVTLTTGVGGSLLSIGSAAGVALMGQAKGIYTFGTHLKWTWAVALGYAAGILTHLALNGR